MEYRIHVADHCHTDDNQDKRKYFFIQKYIKKSVITDVLQSRRWELLSMENKCRLFPVALLKFKLQKYTAYFSASVRKYVKH
jgi:hypothetical protein